VSTVSLAPCETTLPWFVCFIDVCTI